MALKITPKFTENDLRNFIEKKLAVLENIVLDRLQQIGEQFVIDARSTETYKDRTANLRGSIGYVIVKDGHEIVGNFEGTQEGQSEAKLLTKEVASKYAKGFVLVCVAGMNYAAAVEAKGYDVITTSSLAGQENLKRSINRLKQSLKK